MARPVHINGVSDKEGFTVSYTASIPKVLPNETEDHPHPSPPLKDFLVVPLHCIYACIRVYLLEQRIENNILHVACAIM